MNAQQAMNVNYYSLGDLIARDRMMHPPIVRVLTRPKPALSQLIQKKQKKANKKDKKLKKEDTPWTSVRQDTSFVGTFYTDGRPYSRGGGIETVISGGTRIGNLHVGGGIGYINFRDLQSGKRTDEAYYLGTIAFDPISLTYLLITFPGTNIPDIHKAMITYSFRIGKLNNGLTLVERFSDKKTDMVFATRYPIKIVDGQEFNLTLEPNMEIGTGILGVRNHASYRNSWGEAGVDVKARIGKYFSLYGGTNVNKVRGYPGLNGFRGNWFVGGRVTVRF